MTCGCLTARLAGSTSVATRTSRVTQPALRLWALCLPVSFRPSIDRTARHTAQWPMPATTSWRCGSRTHIKMVSPSCGCTTFHRRNGRTTTILAQARQRRMCCTNLMLRLLLATQVTRAHLHRAVFGSLQMLPMACTWWTSHSVPKDTIHAPHTLPAQRTSDTWLQPALAIRATKGMVSRAPYLCQSLYQ